MRIKICGLRRARDVEQCVQLGATHVGFVLEPGTPRFLAAEEVRALVRDLPLTVQPVLVLRSFERVDPYCVATRAGVLRVQVHRFEEHEARALEARGVTVLRAHDMTRAVPPPRGSERAPVVLDVGAGGSGRTFDWTRLAPRAPRHAFLAGGLTPRNLPRLLELDPWGIDLSSGVESAPGVKDSTLLRELFACLGGARS